MAKQGGKIDQKMSRTIDKKIKKAEKKHEELKFLETSQTAFSVSSTPTLQNLSVVPQGVTVTTRVGDSLEVKALELKYFLYQVNVNIVTTVRVIVFFWRPNVTLLAPLASTVLQATGGTQVTAFPSFDYRTQFKFIYDETHSMAGIVASPTGISSVSSFKITLTNMAKKQIYSPGSTGSNNALYIMFMSDVAANEPTITYNARLTFVDA